MPRLCGGGIKVDTGSLRAHGCHAEIHGGGPHARVSSCFGLEAMLKRCGLQWQGVLPRSGFQHDLICLFFCGTSKKDISAARLRQQRAFRLYCEAWQPIEAVRRSRGLLPSAPAFPVSLKQCRRKTRKLVHIFETVGEAGASFIGVV